MLVKLNMGKILEELEKHLVDVAEKVSDHVNQGDFGEEEEWEVEAITIVTGRGSEDKQFHTVVHTKGLSVPEIVGTLELVKIGIVSEALSDE